MQAFYEALTGTPNEQADAPHHLFAQFVGEWDFEWIDGKDTAHERHVPGEWIFSAVLEGKVIQDVFICPSRAERVHNPQPDGEYGTTIRFYNAQKQVWDVVYGYDGRMIILEGKRQGSDIVLTNRDETDGLNQWMFTDITPTSFHWVNRTLLQDGKTWRVNGELFARRRA